MMPIWTYTVKCQSKHSYNFQDATIEGRWHAVVFSPPPNSFHSPQDAQVSTQNDNPNDGWQLSAASEMHFLRGEDMLVYSWAVGMRHTGKVPAGGVNFTCETERVPRKMLERLRFISHPLSASLSCPNQKVRSLLPHKEGYASCSTKRAVWGLTKANGHSLLSFSIPLRACHNYNILCCILIILML